MRRSVLFILFAVLLAATTFCDKLPINPPSDGPKGSFSYTAFDSTGTAVVSGWFTMVKLDSISFSGEWHFKQIAESHELGPQVGIGSLVGGNQGTVVWINLNPQMADNNVFLQGKLMDDVYKGEWMWSTFIGPTTGGRFTAVRK